MTPPFISIGNKSIERDSCLSLLTCLMVSVLLHLLLTFITENGNFFPDSLQAAEFSLSTQSHGVILARLNAPRPLPPTTPFNQATNIPNTLVKTGGETPHPGPSAASPEDPLYYEPEQLTQPPRLTSPLSLDDAELFGQTHSWSIKLRLLIDANGLVQQVLISESTLDPEYKEGIIKALMRATFEPGRISKDAVRSQYLIEINYAAPDSLPANIRLAP